MRKIIILFIFIILFSLSFRLNLYNTYPKGYDTFTMYKLSNDIINKKYIGWTENPLSLTGFYPISYQTSANLLLSIISSTLGINITYSILIWDLFLVIFLAIIIYLISHSIFKNRFTAIITVLIYLNTNYVIYFTDWFYSSRNLFLVLLLFFVWVLISREIKHRLLLLFFILTLLTITHRMIIIMPLFILSYVLSSIFSNPKYNLLRFKYLFLGLAIISIFISLIIFPFLFKYVNNSQINFSIGNIFNDLINLGIYYGGQIGILSIFIPLGYISFIFNKKFDITSIFFLMTITSLLLFISDETYVSYVILPFLVMLIAYGIKYVCDIFHNKLYFYILVSSLIIICLIVPLFINVGNNNREFTIVMQKTISLQEYILAKNNNKSFVCNNIDIFCSQLTALTNNKIDTISAGSELTHFDKYNLSEVKIKLSIKKLFVFEDPIIKIPYYENIYQDHLVTYYLAPEMQSKILNFTNVGYIIDIYSNSYKPNDALIIRKYGYINKIYDNSFEGVRKLNDIY